MTTPRIRSLVLVVALVAIALSGCRERRGLRWELEIEDPTLRAQTVLVHAEIRRGGCDESGEQLYFAEVLPGDSASGVPVLGEGTYAFAAIARDASCVELAFGCQQVELPESDGATVRTLLVALGPTGPICTDCVDGRCTGGLDAGSPDAGTDAASDDDAGAEDAGGEDAATDDDAAIPPTDAGVVGPDAPRLVAPWNGLATGSVLARPRAVAGAPLRPRFAWERVVGAVRYEVQLDDGCAAGAPSACDFAAARVRTLSSTTSASGSGPWVFEPSEDLLPASATRGARVHFRVRSCDASACGAWSSEVRWIDVGRDRHDVDGDGRGDVLVGSPGSDGGGTNSGSVHLYRGTSTGLSSGTTLALPSRGADAWLGSAVALGDLDGDGFADAVVSASRATVGGTGAGALVVLRGSAAGLDVAGARSISAPDAAYERYFGASVAIVDDTDGDGFRDVLVGAPRTAAVGRAYLFRGDPSAVLLSAPSARFDDPDGSTTSAFGWVVAPAYDVDGDGGCDLLIGAPAAPAGGSARGRAWLVRASAPATLVSLAGPADDDTYFGFSLTGVGDLDEDGYADVAVGAPYVDFEATETDEGEVFLFRGGATGLDASRILASPDRGVEYDFVHAGWSLAAGDLDGDGHVDLVVPEPAIDTGSGGPLDIGSVVVHRGNGDGSFGTVVYFDSDAAPQGDMEYGRSVAVIDLDGDGRAEVVGGAHQWDSGSNSNAGRISWHEDPFGAATLDGIPGPTATGSPMFGWSLPGSVGRLARP